MASPICITIAPLSTPDTISAAALSAIRAAKILFLQTERHPAAYTVVHERLPFTTMDDLYEEAKDFDELSRAIAARLLAAGDCVYAVTGDILQTQLPEIRKLVEAQNGTLIVLPGITLAQAAFAELPIGRIAAAAQLTGTIDPDLPLMVEEIDSCICAGELKLLLNEYYPDEWEILLARLTEEGTWVRCKLPLFQLDQQQNYDATTVLYVPPVPFEQRERHGYRDLCNVIRRLRAPGGCPWDREQTHQSLKATLLEECYELLDAIDEGNDAHLTEELGDVLMQVVFHADIAAGQGRFNERDVATGVVQKLVYRHPHVFGDVKVSSSDEVLVNWDKLKMVEKSQKTQTDVLNSVPRNLPALVRSKKVQKKAAAVGFDWNSAEEALPKVREEIDELDAAMAGNGNIAEETGDLLFSVVNVARLLHLDPEFLLLESTDKFTNRFAAMEKLATERGHALDSLTFDEQNALWDEVKTARNRG